MGTTTGISWCDHTFNPWIGCTKVSQGCKNCYAETQNKRYNWTAGWGKGAPRRRTSEANWRKPLEWARAAVRDGVTRRVFCASLADVFDEEVPQEWRADLWNLIRECNYSEMYDVYGSGLEWLILTKRPENIARMMPPEWLEYRPNCIRLGVTCEDQENANKRIHQLFRAWKGPNFISYEPALGPVNFREFFVDTPVEVEEKRGFITPTIDWIICGGESGPGCRPMDLEWARDVRDHCKAAYVPFFMKQLGGHPKKRHDPAEWPADLRIQEFPE